MTGVGIFVPPVAPNEFLRVKEGLMLVPALFGPLLAALLAFKLDGVGILLALPGLFFLRSGGDLPFLSPGRVADSSPPMGGLEANRKGEEFEFLDRAEK